MEKREMVRKERPPFKFNSIASKALNGVGVKQLKHRQMSSFFKLITLNFLRVASGRRNIFLIRILLW